MGMITCTFPNLEVEVPLSPSTRLGRHWSNDVVISDPTMPLHWVEVRWEERKWRFRCFTGEGRTRAKGPRSGDWTGLRAEGSQRSRVTIDEIGYFELTDATEPRPMLVDIRTGFRHTGHEVEGVIFASGITAEGGTLFWGGRLFRIEGVAPLIAAQVGDIDIAHPGCHIDVDLDTLTAQISQGNAQVVLEGEPVRTLAVYVAARASGEEEGWLSSGDAYAAWLHYGGSETSPIARIGWERGKLRRGLSSHGVDNTKALFSVRRRGAKSAVRLGLDSERVRLL